MSKVVVRKVQAISLHGFKPGELILDEMDAGLNVVFAYNAKGKSTLAKAIGLLFNPKGADKAIVDGVIEQEGQSFVRTVRKGDQPFPGAPNRPEDYLLDVVLLLAGLQDKQLDILTDRLGNGISLEATTAPRLMANRIADYGKRRERLQTVRRNKADLAEHEDRLDGLEKKQERAVRSAMLAKELEGYASLLRSQAEIEALEARIRQIDELHPGIDQQSEGVVKQGKLLSESMGGLLGEVDELLLQLRIYRRDGVEAQVPVSSADAESLAQLQSRSAQLEARIAEIRRVQARAQERARASRDAVFALLPGVDGEELPPVTATDFDEALTLATLADEARVREASREGFQMAHRQWVNLGDAAAHENLDSQLSVLRAWLSAERPNALDNRPKILVAVAIVFAFGAAIPSELTFRLITATAGLVAALSAWTFLKPTRNDGPTTDLPGTGLSPGATAAEAIDLWSKLEDARLHREIAKQLHFLASQQVEPLCLPDLAKQLKIQDAYRLAPCARAVSEYVDATIALAAAVGETNSLEEQLAGAAAQAAEVLAGYEFPSEPHALSSINPFNEYIACCKDLNEKRRQVSVATVKLNEILDRAGVPKDSDLESRLKLLKDRESPAVERREWVAELRAATKPEQASPNEGLLAEAFGESHIEEITPSRLQELIELHAANACDKERIHAEIHGIHMLLDQAEGQRELEEVETAYEEGRRQVDQYWRDLVNQSVVHQVMSYTREKLRTEELPPILNSANVWLQRFTGGRYKLEFSTGAQRKLKEGLGVLAVFDWERNEEKTFAQLSTGTKVHATIALRLGLIEQQELEFNQGKLKFPLLADEIMAVSDPVASRAVAAALAEISKDRQVIFFTNQPEDIAVIKEVDHSANLIEIGSSAFSAAEREARAVH